MNPVLFILMRTDMDSMNAGKAMAQSAHAANQFVFSQQLENPDLLYKEWLRQGYGFGTTIVLGVKEEEMKNTIKLLSSFGSTCGIVRDLTYPVRDGEITHLVPIDTCAYVFIDTVKDIRKHSILKQFKLHP